MGGRKRDSSRKREQAIIDRAERIAAFRLNRILTADSALPLGIAQERIEGDDAERSHKSSRKPLNEA